MICKQCGTQSPGDRCTHCGAVLATENAEKPQAISFSAPAVSEPARRSQNIPKIKAVSSFRLRFAALMMLLPLSYLFFDVFATVSDLLFEPSALSATGSGLTLSVLISHLISFEYTGVDASDIKAVIVGTEEGLVRLFSVRDLSATATLKLPLVTVLICVLLCAVMGVLLLLFGKRLVRYRAFADGCVLAGLLGALAPFVGLLALRLFTFLKGGDTAADVKMYRVMLSVESVLLIGVAACLLLPALLTVRRASAAQREELVHVNLPCYLLSGSSFALTKLLALLCTIGTLAVAGALLVLPVFMQGKLPAPAESFDHLLTHGDALGSSFTALMRGEGSALSFDMLSATLIDAAELFFLFMLFLGLLSLLPTVIRLLRAKRHTLCAERGQCRSLKRTGDRTRHLFFFPYGLFIVVQALFVLLLTFGSQLWLHLDLSAAGETTELFYILAAYARMLCGVNTLYWLLAFSGFALSALAHGFALKLILLSQKE